MKLSLRRMVHLVPFEALAALRLGPAVKARLPARLREESSIPIFAALVRRSCLRVCLRVCRRLPESRLL